MLAFFQTDWKRERGAGGQLDEETTERGRAGRTDISRSRSELNLSSEELFLSSLVRFGDGVSCE